MTLLPSDGYSIQNDTLPPQAYVPSQPLIASEANPSSEGSPPTWDDRHAEVAALEEQVTLLNKALRRMTQRLEEVEAVSREQLVEDKNTIAELIAENRALKAAAAGGVVAGSTQTEAVLREELKRCMVTISALENELGNYRKQTGGSVTASPSIDLPVTTYVAPHTNNAPDYQEKLTIFYTTHNPEHVNDVPRILSEFKGAEMHLFEALAAKYGVSVESILTA